MAGRSCPGLKPPSWRRTFEVLLYGLTMTGFSLLDRYPSEHGDAWGEILAARRQGHADFTAPETIMGRIYGPLLQPLAPGQTMVIGQLGQSLDGRIATVTGESRNVNGANAFVHLHRLRALCDAVVVGVGTALADNPRLTVRLVEGPSPARVIIDPRGRLSADVACLEEDGTRRIIIRAEGTDRPLPPGTELAAVRPQVGGGFAPHAILAALEKRGLRRILIEGGANTVSRFLAAGALDRLHLMVAPMIMGSGLHALELPPISSLTEALRPAVAAYDLGDGEVLYDCALVR